MTHDEHRARHQQLHRAVDELLADYMRAHPYRDIHKPYLDMPLRELIDWSYAQTIDPDEPKQ